MYLLPLQDTVGNDARGAWPGFLATAAGNVCANVCPFSAPLKSDCSVSPSSYSSYGLARAENRYIRVLSQQKAAGVDGTVFQDQYASSITTPPMPHKPSQTHQTQAQPKRRHRTRRRRSCWAFLTLKCATLRMGQFCGSLQDPPVRFKPGFYALLRPTFVALDADDFSPDDADLVAKLPEGMALWQRKSSAMLASTAKTESQGSRNCGSGGLCQGGESVPGLDIGTGPLLVHLLCYFAVLARVLNRGGAGSATSTDGLPS